MSYELDKLKREVDVLQYTKVDNWQLRDVAQALIKLQDKVTHLENELSYFLQRKNEEE